MKALICDRCGDVVPDEFGTRNGAVKVYGLADGAQQFCSERCCRVWFTNPDPVSLRRVTHGEAS